MKVNQQLTVPLMDTMIVPVTEPNRRPADMVNGIAGIARIYKHKLKVQTSLVSETQRKWYLKPKEC